MTSENDDRAWALMRSAAFEEELRVVREEGEKVALYAQLRHHALSMGRKLGWAAYFFKSVYGHWPDRAWEKVPPLRPTENTMAIIEARDRKFVFDQKMKRKKEEIAAHAQRAENETEGASGVGGGEEEDAGEDAALD